MKLLYDVGHHACCITFSALVDHLHFHLFFLSNVYLWLTSCAYFSIVYALLALHLCSCEWLLFHLWFDFGFVFYFYFVCLLCVFMCRVCMVFIPITSITYYCFMLCLSNIGFAISIARKILGLFWLGFEVCLCCKHAWNHWTIFLDSTNYNHRQYKNCVHFMKLFRMQPKALLIV